MVTRLATSITTVVVLMGSLVACGETTQSVAFTTEPEPTVEKTSEEAAKPLAIADQYDKDNSEVLSAVAEISIILDEGVEPDEFPYRREWMPASIEVFIDSILIHEGRAGIHVRGNTSRDFDKKSFALETWDDNDQDHDVALLGLPAEEDWILQGPFSDKSLIRNHLI